MPDPQIARLEQEAAKLSASEKSIRARAYRANGEVFYREMAEADAMAAQVAANYKRIKSMSQQRTREIRLIQTARRALAMTDDSYRALCGRITGARSAGDMTAVQRKQMIDEFKRLGFRPVKSRRHGRRPHNMSPGDMRTKIEAQLTDMGLSWSYAESILRRMRSLPAGVACPLSGASPAEFGDLIAALHVEQEKRQLIAAIDDWLTAHDTSHEQIAADRGLKAGWQRRRRDLKALYWDFYGRAFVLDRGETHA